jgi:AbrB family looped-hinge helix DNA binding protein
MRYESTITSKGTITIAAPIRKALGLKPGQTVRLELDKKNDRVLLDAGISPEDFEAARERLVSKIPKRKLGMSALMLRNAIEKAKKADRKKRYTN